MVRALMKREFIAKAIKVHGNKYNYSKVFYENNSTEVSIICPSHSDFWQTPNAHLSKRHGCQSCGGTKLKSKDRFIQQANKAHGSYDYSKVKYINNNTKVIITCFSHGGFQANTS